MSIQAAAISPHFDNLTCWHCSQSRHEQDIWENLQCTCLASAEKNNLFYFMQRMPGMSCEGLPLSNVLNDLKSFVICYIYGDTQSSSLNLARATKWKRQKKKSLMCLFPDDDSLEKHIKRANFLAYIQRYPDLRRHSSPIGHGWELVNQTRVPHKAALPIDLFCVRKTLAATEL